MKQNIITHFTELGRFKIVFNPAIRVGNPPVWIDDMSMANKQYIVTLSTHDDNCKRTLDSLEPEQLQALETRLCSMVNQKQTA